MMTRLIVLLLAIFVPLKIEGKEKVLDRKITISLVIQHNGESELPLNSEEMEVVKKEISKIFAEAGVSVFYSDPMFYDSTIQRVNLFNGPLRVCPKANLPPPMGCALFDFNHNPIWAYVDVKGLKEIEAMIDSSAAGRLVALVVVHETVHLLNIRHKEEKTVGLMKRTHDAQEWLDSTQTGYWSSREIKNLRARLKPPN